MGGQERVNKLLAVCFRNDPSKKVRTIPSLIFSSTTALTRTVRTHTQVKRAAAEALRVVDKSAQTPPLQVGNEVFEPPFSALGAQNNGEGGKTAMTEEERKAALAQVQQ